MTPRQARRERREAGRKAKKLARKQGLLPEKDPLPSAPIPEILPRWNPALEDEFPREVQIRNNAMADRIALAAGLPIPPPGPSPQNALKSLLRHRALAEKPATTTPEPLPPPAPDSAPATTQAANPGKSTGPRTPTGKLASSRNALKHGLASATLLIPGEAPAAFDAFLASLLAEHQPTTPTEQLLIEEMAQSHWLTQRAIRLQTGCFNAEGVSEKQLALFLRYQTTHQRAFYRALDTLLRAKKQAARIANGFVSQPRPAPPENPEFVSQPAPETPRHPQFVRQKAAHAAPEIPCNASTRAA